MFIRNLISCWSLWRNLTGGSLSLFPSFYNSPTFLPTTPFLQYKGSKEIFLCNYHFRYEGVHMCKQYTACPLALIHTKLLGAFVNVDISEKQVEMEVWDDGSLSFFHSALLSYVLRGAIGAQQGICGVSFSLANLHKFN